MKETGPQTTNWHVIDRLFFSYLNDKYPELIEKLIPIIFEYRYRLEKDLETLKRT